MFRMKYHNPFCQFIMVLIDFVIGGVVKWRGWDFGPYKPNLFKP
ncbi:hypothetical protein PL11201_470051 [Planktothrix sp. PCC 11201]|nr:hypothetical protein PL11201_470051 [Planktothrix sp. PCC 11201]